MTELRCAELLSGVKRVRILVVGDVMLDHFVWGRARRISPEAPVPVVEFERESYMAGGAANVATNLSTLGCKTTLYTCVGRDHAGDKLAEVLHAMRVDLSGLLPTSRCQTAVKMRVVCGQQQIVRLDQELNIPWGARAMAAVRDRLEQALDGADAVIIGDYGKGAVSQSLLNLLRRQCAKRGVWLSLDPKPTHSLDLSGLSLLTPNRREAFQLAGLLDATHNKNPLVDTELLRAGRWILDKLQPEILLITLGELGMLLWVRGEQPIHIGTAAREVFDVSGAGDTVIASFTLAIAAGATPVEAADFSNRAAGVVVGKIGTATVTASELRRSFRPN